MFWEQLLLAAAETCKLSYVGTQQCLAYYLDSALYFLTVADAVMY